jgi:hypothetical protein
VFLIGPYILQCGFVTVFSHVLIGGSKEYLVDKVVTAVDYLEKTSFKPGLAVRP